MPEYFSKSPDQTAEIAIQIAALIPAPAVIQLTGNLGAGKTTLTKFLVEAWGAAMTDDVSSPTYTLIHEYGEPVAVYHIDLYRLETPNEFYSLGLDEIFDSPARVLIEWGEKFDSLLPIDRWIIHILHAEGDNRRIIVSHPGPRTSPPPYPRTSPTPSTA